MTVDCSPCACTCAGLESESINIQMRDVYTTYLYVYYLCALCNLFKHIWRAYRVIVCTIITIIVRVEKINLRAVLITYLLFINIIF